MRCALTRAPSPDYSYSSSWSQYLGDSGPNLGSKTPRSGPGMGYVQTELGPNMGMLAPGLSRSLSEPPRAHLAPFFGSSRGPLPLFLAPLEPSWGNLGRYFGCFWPPALRKQKIQGASAHIKDPLVIMTDRRSDEDLIIDQPHAIPVSNRRWDGSQWSVGKGTKHTCGMWDCL